MRALLMTIVVAVGLVAAGLFYDPSGGAVHSQGTTVYAEFDSSEARGIVEIAGFGEPNAVVTARMRVPDSGVVGFCLVVTGQLGCQSRSSAIAGFTRDDHGCVTFVITFSEPVVFVGILNEAFVVAFDLAPITTTPPRGLGSLNKCR